MAFSLALTMHIHHAPTSKNLVSGLSWTAGASTTLTDTNGLARATATTNGVNPVIFKGPFTLISGKTYRLEGKAYQRTAGTNCIFRVSLVNTLATADFYGTTISSGGGGQSFNGVTFSAGSGGSAYLGIIPGIVNSGEYSEIDDGFYLVQN